MRTEGGIALDESARRRLAIEEKSRRRTPDLDMRNGHGHLQEGIASPFRGFAAEGRNDPPHVRRRDSILSASRRR
jgi:hypothetical protein